MVYERFSRSLKVLLLTAGILLGCGGAEAKRKTDVVVMKNGDRLTGEVKKLENGILYVETEYFAGSIGLDWAQVERVVSTAGYQVLLKDGSRITGKISKQGTGEENRDFTIVSEHKERRAYSEDVVDIRPQKRAFWSQVNGSTSFGYSYTSGNGQQSLSTDLEANYRSTRWFGGANVSASYSGESDTNRTILLDLQTLDGIYLTRKSFLMGLADFLHSSQQDLALRTTLGGGYGRFVLRTNHQYMVWMTGLVYTHEKFQSVSAPASENAEALFGTQYQLFRFNRYGLKAQFLAYPGLTDAPRIRTTGRIGASVKLNDRFYMDIQYWNNFDSKPPFDTKKVESGVSNSLGWTF
jgi:putative salt-induced outer membrane protein YdiY